VGLQAGAGEVAAATAAGEGEAVVAALVAAEQVGWCLACIKAAHRSCLTVLLATRLLMFYMHLLSLWPAYLNAKACSISRLPTWLATPCRRWGQPGDVPAPGARALLRQLRALHLAQRLSQKGVCLRRDEAGVLAAGAICAWHSIGSLCDKGHGTGQ